MSSDWSLENWNVNTLTDAGARAAVGSDCICYQRRPSCVGPLLFLRTDKALWY